MYLSVFLSTSKQPTGASAGKKKKKKKSVAYYRLFSTPKGGGGTGKRLRGATLPPADHRNQNASKPGRKSILPARFSGRGLANVVGKLLGDAPEDQRKKGNLWKGPGQTTPGPREFRSTRPQNHSEAGKKSGRPGSSGVAEGWFWACPGEQ
ncbi:unnamed protein product [Rangifer tarandus platyrhynchus]|uniref:Myelin basic protein n=1 Tax=Rangifer tarandus platyrhynchus TaxID=3082113 RepID=A0ABN9A6B7_RANTA|nr:unnamed protein product [Rangifer tarandus platyrhynchus]